MSSEKKYDTISVVVDCSRDAVWSMDSAQLLNSIYLCIVDVVDGNNNYGIVKKSEGDIDIASISEKLIACLLTCPKPVIVFFDEFDYITPSSPTSLKWKSEYNVFWRNFRAVYQECCRNNNNLSLFICGVTSKWFLEESIEGVENAALALIPEEYLCPLPRGASVSMIRKTGKIAGLLFDETAADLIASLVSDMPYWIRKACSFIHQGIDASERPLKIQPLVAEGLVKDFIKTDGVAIVQLAIRHLFKVYPELRASFDKCYRGDVEGLNQNHARILANYGLIVKKDCKLSGLIVKEGYELFGASSDGEVNPEDTAVQVVNLELNEWADEIAVVSKRRNILEKNLRTLALNFIRADCLRSGKKPKDVALSVIPSKFHPEYSALGAEDVFARYAWTNLVQLVIKEWSLFGQIFGDQKNFKHCCDIINDRYDAHAKEADMADFALYRRCLSSVESMLKKVM